MNLYFIDNENKEHLVAGDADASNAVVMAIEDLERRRPKFKSYYQRVWLDEFNRYWIDYGSHTEFYRLEE